MNNEAELITANRRGKNGDARAVKGRATAERMRVRIVARQEMGG